MNKTTALVNKIKYLYPYGGIKDSTDSLEYMIVDYFSTNNNAEKNAIELQLEKRFREYDIPEITKALKSLNEAGTLISIQNADYSYRTIAEASAGYRYYLDEKVINLHEYIKDLVSHEETISLFVDSEDIINLFEKLSILKEYLKAEYYQEPISSPNENIAKIYIDIFNLKLGLYSRIRQTMRKFREKVSDVSRASQQVIKNIDIGNLSKDYISVVNGIVNFTYDFCKVTESKILEIKNDILEFFLKEEEEVGLYNFCVKIYDKLPDINKGIGQKERDIKINEIKNNIINLATSEKLGAGTLSMIRSQLEFITKNLINIRDIIIKADKIMYSQKFFLSLADEFNACKNEYELKQVFDSYFSTSSVNFFTKSNVYEEKNDELTYNIPVSEKKKKKESVKIYKDFDNETKRKITEKKQYAKDMADANKRLVSKLFDCNGDLVDRVYTKEELKFLLKVFHTSSTDRKLSSNNSIIKIYKDKYTKDSDIYIKISTSDTDTVWRSNEKKRTYFDQDVKVRLVKANG